ncbi:mercuric reductase [Meiothermus sp.]|uniref:mercuric reductase n=1 Tax=Meiothermus sp. TaxID=1955249 RepID=UPI0021DF1A21|nr:mercuric reductase [Meiothermus sp.]GIW24285.1 MAG: mercuric reductase [Meiothermus sp.]
MKRFDAVIIGAGQAGPALAGQLVKHGRKVAIAEGYRFGGSCVNYGCRPTKTLIASARAVHMARRGLDFGFSTGFVEVNWDRVRERVIQIVESTSAGIEKGLRSMEGLEVYSAYAAFEGQHNGLYRVRVGDEVVEAPQVFLNTGTRALVPPIEGIDQVPWLDSEGLLHLEVLPRHLIILGGSYIGLEMGQAFRRLGSQVTIIETSECLINREDEDIKKEVHRVFQREGIAIHTFSKVYKVEPSSHGGVLVYLRNEQDGSEHVLTGSHWLIAIGRVPNSDKLNLDSVGIETDGRGYIKVNEHLQTTAPGVYALGDVNGKGAFTHTSYQDYEIVRDNLLYGANRKHTDRTMTYALFTDPPLGGVGMSEQEARDSGRRVLMAVKPMKRIGRAVEQDETDGLIKLLVDADSEQFLGASVLGLHGDEVVQAISYFMATGSSYRVMMNTLPIHPTVAEFLPTLLGELKPLD